MAIKNLIEQLDDETNLVIKIDSYLESMVQKRKPDGYYHPSMAGDCLRAIWYYQTGASFTPFSGEVMRKMENGTDAHIRIQRYLKEIGVLIQAESAVNYDIVKPAPKIGIVGSCDAIIKDNGKKLFEFKTAISWNYNSVVKTNKPLPGHFEQWCCYSYGERIWEGMIVYENKDTQQLHPVLVKFDKVVFNKIVKKFKLVQTHIKLDKPPDRPAKGMSDKICLYCNYKSVCWERKKH